MRARIAGTEIEYDDRGKGRPAVLLLHAFPLSLAMWEAQAEALAPTHRVVRFDVRGFGGTPPGDGMLTMEGIADDAAALLDRLDLQKAVVCGCSMGGYAAFAMVRKHADRLKALVLLDTRAEPDNEEGRRNRALLAEKVRQQGASAALEAFLPRLLGETTQKQRPEVVERVRGMVLGASPRGIADALGGLAARADSVPTLREIRVPTLVACGAEDVLTPRSDAEAMQRAIPGARLETIPRSGHLPSLEQPQALNQVLKGFLASL